MRGVLWEERRFADGQGSYFFSPACGQIRLHLGETRSQKSLDDRPAPIGGGVCADEMGLGMFFVVVTLECFQLSWRTNMKF